MPQLILFITIAILIFLLLHSFANANPYLLARKIRKMGGWLALLGAFFFTATGRFPLAVPLAIFGITLLLRNMMRSAHHQRMRQAGGAGQQSTVRTSILEMALDHNTGSMDGRILSGKFAGQILSALSLEDLLAFRTYAMASDMKTCQLLDAYLDRTHPEWRKATDEKTDSDYEASPGGDGRMTKMEAYQILGLSPGASAEDINRAHRTLMKQFHPDQGGSTYLATKINQAKDLLLGE